MSSRTAVLILRESALALGERVARGLNADLIKGWEANSKPADLFRDNFHARSAWVLVMSTGIAVRFLDGLPKDKRTDPAVVCLDEGCHHAISLLSGHEGGANDLAYAVANLVGANPVVSTATESRKPLVLGIGCRRGVSAAAIREAVLGTLGNRSLDEVRCIATIDIKRDEPGLVEFCNEAHIPMRVLDRASVAARAWVTAPSQWVRDNVGVDGVCEPCALMATPRGRLVVPKTTMNGVAVAVVDDSENTYE